MVEPRALGGVGPRLERDPFAQRLAAAFRVALPPGAHHLGERNAHRADLLAPPAEARGVGKIAGVIDALQGRGQHRAHRPGIDRSVGVPPDRPVHRAVVEAGAAADAAQHVLEDASQHLAPPVVEQDDVIGAGAVRVARAARSGGEARVGRHVLARGRAGEEAEDGHGVLERRHHLLDRGEHDMDARQRLGEVAVALVGEDHRAPRLGDQEIGAGDADIGGEECRAQDGARLGHEVRRRLELAPGGEFAVRAAEIGLDRLFVEVDDRGDDMARAVAPDLDDVFAEVGLDHLEARLFEMGVEPDLLRDHRLALGDALCVRGAAESEHDVARLLRIRSVVHRAAALGHLALIGLEVEVEMPERMVLDGARLGAKRLELRQSFHRRLPLEDEAALDVEQRALEFGIGEGPARVAAETRAC